MQHNLVLKGLTVKTKWKTQYVMMLFYDKDKPYLFYINLNAYRRKSQIDKQLACLSRQAAKQGYTMRKKDYGTVLGVYLKAVQIINSKVKGG